MNFETGDHSSIYLYAQPACIYAHCIKIILAAKDVGYQYEVLDDSKTHLDEFSDINPEGKLPFFIDRDLQLSNVTIICEYLDERFPHPPLMPIEPAMRARYRAALSYVYEDLYASFVRTQSINKKTVKNARKELQDGIMQYADAFQGKNYFMNKEIGLLDCMYAPLLWRLKSNKINLTHKAILQYQKRMFAHPNFRISLSEEEADLDLE